MSVEDWEGAKEATQSLVELKGSVGPIELILMAACQARLLGISTSDSYLEAATRIDSDRLSTEDLALLGLCQRKFAGMLTADPSDEAFARSEEVLCSPVGAKPGDWYWNRIFTGWLLRANDATVRQARKQLAPVSENGEPSINADDIWLVGWIDAQLGKSDEAISALERDLESPSRNFMDMMFLAKAFSDAGRPEDAARAAFESRLLFDVEWHPDQPNKHLQPEIRWAYAMAQKQLEAMEAVLPKYEPARPELRYLLAAVPATEIEAAPNAQARPTMETYKQACIDLNWSAASKAAWQLFEAQPSENGNWIKAASTSLLADDDTGYRQLCKRLLGQFGNTQDPSLAHMLCKVCLLQPNVVDLNLLPDSLFIKELEADQTLPGLVFWRWTTRALLALRHGDDALVLDFIKESDEHNPKDTARAFNLALKAIVAQRTGQAAEYDTAVTEMNQVFDRLRAAGDVSHQDYLAAEVLRREAVAMGEREQKHETVEGKAELPKAD